MKKKYTKTDYLQRISSASHTVESNDKTILSLCNLYSPYHCRPISA